MSGHSLADGMANGLWRTGLCCVRHMLQLVQLGYLPDYRSPTSSAIWAMIFRNVSFDMNTRVVFFCSHRVLFHNKMDVWEDIEAKISAEDDIPVFKTSNKVGISSGFFLLQTSGPKCIVIINGVLKCLFVYSFRKLHLS